MKQKNADLLLLIQAGLLGFFPLFAMLLLKTKKIMLFLELQQFLYISKISLTDQRWIIALLVTITAGAGIAIYYQSGKTKRGALLCLSSFAFLKSLLFLPMLVQSVFFTPGDQWADKKVMIIALLYYMLWFAISLVTLIYFSRKERKQYEMLPPALAETNDEDVLDGSELDTTTLVIAGKEKRFANYMADSFIIVLAAGPVISFYLGIKGGSIYEDGGYQSALLESAIGLVVYYGLFEICFRSTPGKYLTGTRVINENGQPVSVLRALGRTLCRLIPFEHFSFLGNRGWHDSISRTDVVEAPQLKTGDNTL
jgi:uncharacterized RDD family membrane protein YckC